MSDISTNALLGHSQFMDKIQLSTSQLTAEIHKLEAANINMIESTIAATNAVKKGYDSVIESIKRTRIEMQKLDKPIKLSINHSDLRNSIQRNFDGNSFKIKVEPVSSGGLSSSGSSSQTNTQTGGGYKLPYEYNPISDFLAVNPITSMILGTGFGSAVGTVAKHIKTRGKSETKSKTSIGSGFDTRRQGYYKPETPSKSRSGGLKSRFSGAGSRLGGFSSFLSEEIGSLSPGRPGNSRTPKMRGKAGILSRAGGLLEGLGEGSGILGKAGGLLKGGKALGMLGKIGGLGLRALGPIGLIASGGMAAFDGYNKWNELKGKGADNWTALKGAAWTGLDSFTMGGASAVAGFIPQSWKDKAGGMLGGVDKALGSVVNDPGKLTKPITDFAGKAVSTLQSLPGRAAGALMSLGSRIWGIISGAMRTAGTYVSNGINQVINFFRLLPGRAASAIMNLGGRIWSIINRVMATARTYVSNGINAVVNFFKLLPGRAASAIGGLLGAIGSRISGALNYARSIVSSGITAVVGFFLSLPGRASSAVSGLLGAIGGRISGALSYAQSIVSSGVNAIINAFWTLPGRVMGALSSLYSTVTSWIDKTLGPLKGLYCIVAGCSPGIIPAFKSMAQEVPKQIGTTIPHIEKFANSLNKVPSNIKVNATGSGSSSGNVVLQKGAVVIEGPVYGIDDLEKKMEKVTLKVLDRETTFY